VGGVTSYLHRDHLASVRFVTDASGDAARLSGYVWRILGVRVPVSFALVLGKGHAEETPINDTELAA